MIIAKILVLFLVTVIKSFWFVSLTLVLLPFALIHLFLSIFNYKYFWETKWVSFINYLDEHKLLPEF